MMTRFRRLLALALTLILAASPPVHAQGMLDRVVVLDYDLDSLTDIACNYNSSPAVRPILIATSGSSTTTAAVVATSQPFAPLSVGDALYVQLVTAVATTPAITAPTLNLVTAKASDDSITVGDAWTIPAAGRTFKYLHRTCHASSDPTWISTEGLTIFNLATSIDQINVASGGIGFKIEAQYTDQPFYQKSFNVWPGDASADAHCGGGTFASGYCVYTATTQNIPLFTSAMVIRPVRIRLVMKLTGTDDGSDVGAAAEKISAFFTGGK